MSDAIEGDPGWVVTAPSGERYWIAAQALDVPDLEPYYRPEPFDAAMRIRAYYMLAAQVTDPRKAIRWNGS
jgi:hypothetical protein